MGSEKAFLLSVIYKRTKKFPQGAAAVEALRGDEKNAPTGGQPGCGSPTLRRRPSRLLSPAARSKGDKKIQEGRK